MRITLKQLNAYLQAALPDYQIVRGRDGRMTYFYVTWTDSAPADSPEPPNLGHCYLEGINRLSLEHWHSDIDAAVERWHEDNCGGNHAR